MTDRVTGARAQEGKMYRYRDDIATADAAFEAWGETLEAMFAAAWDAAMNVMVVDLETIRPVLRRRLEVGAEAVDMLLFAFLQELIFYKDAEQLLLRVANVQLSCRDSAGILSRAESGSGGPATRRGRHRQTAPGCTRDDTFYLTAEAHGEQLDPARHDLIVDVKAVTLHRFRVAQTSRGWEALVVLDL